LAHEKKKLPYIESFDFSPGRTVARKYKIVSKLGAGWEAEVYKLVEIETGIVRAGKFFFPERNPRNKTLKFYAKKLHKLRNCSVLIQYNSIEQIQFRRHPIYFMVSEFVEGVLLSRFLESFPGKRLGPFQGLHLLYELAKGMEQVHRMKEYHGDLHAQNVIVAGYGLSFDIKLIDLFHWKSATRENIQDDVCDLIQIFYTSIGGKKFYAKQPKEIKDIICGLKRSLILKKFKTASQLRLYLENMRFESVLKGQRL
jgi:serine/threonine protein kinase